MLGRQVNFIRQQGFEVTSAQSCAILYPALQFQPRVIGVIMIAAALLRSPALFFALAALLAWSALLPAANPFEAVYNRFIAARKGRPPLPAAPGPRRFAQGLAAALLLIIAMALLTKRPLLAAAVAALLFAALGAILFRGFCFGSFVFHLLTGNGRFARRTMPWSRGG